MKAKYPVYTDIVFVLRIELTTEADSHISLCEHLLALNVFGLFKLQEVPALHGDTES